MRQVIARQASSLNSSGLENSTRQVKELQQAQAKDNEQIIKSLTDKNGEGLNSNVIKLSDHMKKMTRIFEGKLQQTMSPEQVGKITDTATGRRQFNTLRPRVDSFKASAKDFFSMRGFLDKTGIIPRNSGGIFSEYLDRGEARKKYVDQYTKMHGGSRDVAAARFNKIQDKQYEMSQNEAKLKELREGGWTEGQIAGTSEAKKRGILARQLSSIDNRVRPESLEGVVSSKAGGLDSGEESMLEQNRMVSDQTELLIKIEENTRGLRVVGGTATGGATAAAEESGGLGLMDLAGGLGKRALGGIKAGASMLGKGAMGAARFLGKNPLAMAGLAVGAGAYAGYKGWQAAGDKEQNAKEDIKAKLESGEITQGEAKKLTEQVSEQAVVERGAAAGKGTGMAVGGAAGALKGAAAGAAIGSVVPVVGTAIGGLIGGTLGAVGGSWLGGKGGEFIGEKAGQLTNWAPKAWDSAKQGASSLWDNTKGKAAGLWEGAKGLAGDAGEGLLRAKNKVSDVGWMAKENAKNLIDANTGGALTKAGNAIGSAKNKVLGMFGMGDQTVDNGDGTRTTFKSDGSRVIEGPGGTKVLDKDGKLISEKSPTFMGASTETRADGSKVESYNSGPMSIRKETTAAGGSQTTGVYDLGTTKVSMRETLTARQMQERGIDAKMAAGLPNKIPVEGGVAPVPAAAESKATGGRVARIAGEEWTAGKELSDKQLAAIESGIAAGNNYSFRLMEQYDKQKGNKRPSVTGGGVSAASVPGIGDTISKQSGENDQARMDAAKGGGGNTVVSAPTINNNTQNQTSSVKLSPRNNDSTVNKYMQSRWAF
jgi:hypothetical protein